MQSITALILDDENSAIRTLRGMLEQFCPQVQVIAEASSVQEGMVAIQQLDPDLVFLDIEIPPLEKGFDLLKKLPGHRFGVIFTTAHPQYAVQAINDVQPWAYVVKPYRVADLVQVMNTVAEKIQSKTIDQPTDYQGLIVSDSRKGNQVILFKNILYCHADSGATDIFYLQQDQIERAVSDQSLKDLEQLLPEQLFCRTHYSFIVNMQHILRYQKTGRNGVIYLPHQRKASISVLKMEQFEMQFRRFWQAG
jgi:two-component system, LytTR family, response regulator